MHAGELSNPDYSAQLFQGFEEDCRPRREEY